MGYIRKHKNSIRSVVELTLVGMLMWGIAPLMILITTMGY